MREDASSTHARFRPEPVLSSRFAQASRPLRRSVTPVASTCASYAPEDAEELVLLGTFIRSPAPELDVLPLDEHAILTALQGPSAAVA